MNNICFLCHGTGEVVVVGGKSYPCSFCKVKTQNPIGELGRDWPEIKKEDYRP